MKKRVQGSGDQGIVEGAAGASAPERHFGWLRVGKRKPVFQRGDGVN